MWHYTYQFLKKNRWHNTCCLSSCVEKRVLLTRCVLRPILYLKASQTSLGTHSASSIRFEADEKDEGMRWKEKVGNWQKEEEKIKGKGDGLRIRIRKKDDPRFWMRFTPWLMNTTLLLHFASSWLKSRRIWKFRQKQHKASFERHLVLDNIRSWWSI